MKVFQLFLICIALAEGAAAQIPQVFPHPSQRNPPRDGSLMKPDDPDYEDAMEFACIVNEKGIKVLSLHRSKLNGMFPGLRKAAFFKTEKGVVEVIFFPKEQGAENVSVTLQRTEGRYLYSFSGCPPLVGGFDSNQPMYFLMRRNWFIVPASEELYERVKRALQKY